VEISKTCNQLDEKCLIQVLGDLFFEFLDGLTKLGKPLEEPGQEQDMVIF
jgi:hypothetical protein